MLIKKNRSKKKDYTTQKITRHVIQHTVHNFQFIKGFPASNTWIVHSDNDAVLVDSGFGDEDSFLLLKKYIDTTFPKIKIHYILLTHNHSDHSSGSRKLAEYFNSDVLIHPLEENMLRAPSKSEHGPVEIRKKRRIWEKEKQLTPIKEYIEEGKIIRAGSLVFQVIHTPGHTLGSNCYLLKNDKLLFSGDTILGYDTVTISAPPDGDMSKYLESLSRLKRFNLNYIAPGHGQIINKPKDKINKLILHRLNREKQIYDLIMKGHKTEYKLMKMIYPNIDKNLKNSAKNQLHAHLARLESLKKIKLQIEKDKWKVI